MKEVQIKPHRKRPIPPRAVWGLYEHVGWSRPASDHDLAEVLQAGPAVGPWDGERLVGFVRALSDDHLAAYVEDVVVHAGYRGSGVGEKLLAQLLEEVISVANVSLFCEPPVAPFYEKGGFRGTFYALMQRGKA